MESKANKESVPNVVHYNKSIIGQEYLQNDYYI